MPPDAAEPEPEPTETAPVPVPVPVPAPRRDSPDRPEPTDPAAEPPTRLPDDLRAAIAALGKRPRKTALRAVIVRLCEGRWTTRAELASYLGMNERNLRLRHIRPLVEAGRLERRHPLGARGVAQAYRAVSGSPR